MHWCVKWNNYFSSDQSASLIRYESVAWIPNVITFIVMLGIGAKNINLAPPTAPIDASVVLSFSSVIVSAVVSWSTMAPDYGVYHSGDASRYGISILDNIVSY